MRHNLAVPEDERIDEVIAWFAERGLEPVVEDQEGSFQHTMWGNRFAVHLRRIGETEPWLPNWGGGRTPEDALRSTKTKWIIHS